ncbi:kelch repeat-containing protein [Streptomyces sp. PSKA30]|uniref:Kelch repeat-containing protein n=1 Tax=Streptomyces sp. PSKA30 TaxID=2874597 RepID=UPI001CD13A87|nr:kelch repeat-containing protein [Streptomyces sp. PSKA30]MBZ9643971.1 hypothetical protein [Streptomyces sp. PSKA30]
MKISRWLLVVFLAPLLALTTTLANAQGVWLALPGLSTPANGLASATAPCPKDIKEPKGNCVYTFGGQNGGAPTLNTVETYNPATNQRKTLPDLPTARYALAGASAPCPKDVEGLRGTCVYAIGGFTGTVWPDPAFDTSTVEAYSPATNAWKRLPGLPTARSQLAATTAPCPKDVEGLKGACVYAIGGAFSDTVEAYSPVTNTWKTLPSLDTPRDAPAAAAAPCPKDGEGLKGLKDLCVYAIGGFNSTDGVLDTVEAYSPATNTWKTLPSKKTPAVALAGAAAPCPMDVDGLKGACVYAVGGFNFTDGVLDTVEAYSPATNTWKTLPDLPTARFELTGASAPCPKNTRGLTRTCVYALGGAGSTAFNALTTVEAFTVEDGHRP